jgi:predicted transcriptional regulator
MAQVQAIRMKGNAAWKKQDFSGASVLETRMGILMATIEGPVSLAHIMNRCNSSRKVLQKNLQALKESGLVREGSNASDRKDYAVTDNGWAMLHYYNEILDSP